MTQKLITLERWASLRYGEDAPVIETLRRWARESRIVPAPVKHGRTYYVPEDAEYMAPGDVRRTRTSNRLHRSIDESKTTQQ